MSPTKNVPAVNTGKLADIMKAEASIAMPEVISIFLSKYETELYERKATLSDKISQLTKEGESLTTTTLTKADFKEYENIKIPKFDLISFQRNERKIKRLEKHRETVQKSFKRISQ